MSSTSPDLSVTSDYAVGDKYVDVVLPVGPICSIVIMCVSCGALVGNKDLHDSWHQIDTLIKMGTS